MDSHKSELVELFIEILFINFIIHSSVEKNWVLMYYLERENGSLNVLSMYVSKL